jgi:glycosyltransferase involved in cell wall biosynthesis
MKTSFISTVFNEEKNIKIFLNSLLNQTILPDEIIIVDGGSRDGTYEILKNYSKNNKKIKVVQEKGANIARGRNLAISLAENDIILTSDAGCIIDKEWVEETIKFFPEYDFIGGATKAISKNNFEFFQGLITVKKLATIARISGRNSAFKKECWKSVGGYPEKSLTGEDHRFHIEIIEKGYKVKMNEKARVAWEMRPNVKSFWKQFYGYGRGDRIQGNLLKREMKKNIVMVFGFWFYFLSFLVLLFINHKISLLMFLIPAILLFLYSFKFLFKTKKISSLFWIPLLIFIKRVSYIMGVSFK